MNTVEHEQNTGRWQKTDTPAKHDHPWYVKSALVALTVWASLNVGVMAWQMALNVWVTSVQAPQAIQAAQREAQQLRQQLDAERAKPKPAQP